MNEIRTHRGFLMATPAAKGAFLTLDVVDQLYAHLKTSGTVYQDFNFLRDVAKAAKAVIFYQGRNLLIGQLTQPSTRWLLSFVTTTLDYVASGDRRTISVENYKDLLDFHPKPDTRFDSYANRDRMRAWDRIAGMSAADFISLWLSREGGLNDLVCSLQLIAGALPDEFAQHPKPLA